jgi:tetrahydromethanopterin S-methyltransferase subunit G
MDRGRVDEIDNSVVNVIAEIRKRTGRAGYSRADFILEAIEEKVSRFLREAA